MTFKFDFKTSRSRCGVLGDVVENKKMKKNKAIIIGFNIFIIFLFSSCGAPTVALLLSWVQTIDHNAEYFKIDQYGNTAEKKFDENEIDFENDYFSISSSIFVLEKNLNLNFLIKCMK